MSGLNRNWTGKSANDWQSKAYAFYQVAYIDIVNGVATAGLPAGGIYKDAIIDGDDASALGFLVVPASGNASITVARSLDNGRTWIDVAALASGSTGTPVEKIEAAPLGWYRVTIAAVAGTVSVRVRKKVPLAPG